MHLKHQTSNCLGKKYASQNNFFDGKIISSLLFLLQPPLPPHAYAHVHACKCMGIYLCVCVCVRARMCVYRDGGSYFVYSGSNILLSEDELLIPAISINNNIEASQDKTQITSNQRPPRSALPGYLHILTFPIHRQELAHQEHWMFLVFKYDMNLACVILTHKRIMHICQVKTRHYYFSCK